MSLTNSAREQLPMGTKANRPVRVLMVEDLPTDAMLMERRLLRSGLNVACRRVADGPALQNAIETQEWDIVLVDYKMPDLNGVEAIRLIRQSGIDIPLVLVSGAIGLAAAIDAMEAGASSFVLKEDLQRLPFVVDREVNRAAYRRAESLDPRVPTLRTLIVEDNASDAELMQRRLRKAGFQLDAVRVDDARGLIEELEHGDWDVILADYQLPSFTGLDVLKVVAYSGADLPVILVSGAIGVTEALEAMKAGARDFVFKNDLQRLPLIVKRELTDAAIRVSGRRNRIQRDDAMEELREAYERLNSLVRMTDFPLHAMTSHELADVLIGRTRVILGADSAVALMLEDDELTVVAADNIDIPGGSTMPRGIGFEGAIAESSSSVFVRDVSTDPLTAGGILDELGVRSALGAPMHSGDEVVGVLYIGWRSPFEPQRWLVPLLELAADKCADALEGARLYEREHRIADTLQHALLSVGPELKGLSVGRFYVSATEYMMAGGDFYDVFEIAPRTFAATIGDVSGKGIDAAAVTALIKNALRAHLLDGDSPSQALHKVNELMHRFTGLETFVTAFVSVIDTLSRRVVYSSAGHTAPFVVGSSGAVPLEHRGPLLGAFPDVDFETSELVLAAGESLVLYTDGLTEARGPAGAWYGEERLASFLGGLSAATPEDMAAELRAELMTFSGHHIRDDVAVLVLRPSD